MVCWKLNQTDGESTATHISGVRLGKEAGTGSAIEYNPNSTGSTIVNADGTTGRPAAIGLGHELGHAEHNNEGTRDKTKVPNITDPDTGTKGTLDKNEISVRQKDSQIRKEQGVVERKKPF